MAKKVIIITGPIGSGKSTATDYLNQLGFKTVDLDMVSNNILNSFESLSFLEKNFPTAVEKDFINKETLASIVFNDKEKLTVLENFLHPQVLTKLQEIISESKRPSSHISKITDQKMSVFLPINSLFMKFARRPKKIPTGDTHAIISSKKNADKSLFFENM